MDIQSKRDLYSIYFLSNSGVVVIMSYLILLMQERGLDETQIGYIAAYSAIATLLSNTFFGRLSDIIGRRKFIIFGLLVSSISTFLFVIPVDYWGFTLARVFNGIALGVFPSSLVGVASDRGMKLGKLSAYGSIGWATGGLLGGYLADVLGLQWLFITSSIFYLLSFLVALFLGTGKGFKPVIRDETRAERNYSRNYPRSYSRMYSKAVERNWMVYLLFILRHGTANAIWIYWALFLKNDLHLTTTQIGVVQATNMITQFVLMRAVTDRLNPRLMLILGGLASSLAFFSFTITTSFLEIVLAQIILGISWALFYVGGLRTVEEQSKKDGIVATGTGLFNASLSTSQIVGPFLAIYLFSISSDYILSMNFASIITLIATSIYFVMGRPVTDFSI